MRVDVTELAEFYERPIGTQVRRLLMHRIRARWRDVHGLSVMGLGFASPYLGTFRNEAARVAALMPGAQGAIPWPSDEPVRTVLVEEDALPLPDHSVHRMLAVHALEMTATPQHMLREIWRVLAPEGRLLLIVPNRRGVWAQRDTTPFGHGEPYSRGQIERLATGAMFGVEDCAFALAVPPIEIGLVWNSATAWERFGTRLWPAFSGVILVDATKQVMGALPKSGLGAAARARLRPLVARPRTLKSSAASQPQVPSVTTEPPAAAASAGSWVTSRVGNPSRRARSKTKLLISPRNS